MEKSKVLTRYDLSGIQNFIFSSNRLKMNIGASIIVAKIFQENLEDIIKENCTNYLIPSDFCNNIRSLEKYDAYDAIIITRRGGNALILFDKIELAKKITQELSKSILLRSAGTLTFNVAYQETDPKNFIEDYKNLLKILNQNKDSTIHSMPLLGIGITKLELSTNLPVCVDKIESEEDITDLSETTKIKLEIEKKYSKYFENLLEYRGSRTFCKDFDEIAEEGANYLAVIHIDGNNMGKLFKEFIETSKDYKDGISKSARFSEQTEKIYHKISKKMIEQLKNWMEKSNLFKNYPKEILPFRPIIISGDDITFVSNGKLALGLTEYFLTELNKEPLNIDQDELQLSACAGIAIAKVKHPFQQVYELALELCKSAKRKGKILATFQNNAKNIGNWIDFHIIQSENTLTLQDIRKSRYQVPGMEQPFDLTEKSESSEGFNYQQYNLLWRPWCVAGICDPKYQWKNLTEMVKSFRNHWPRSKFKGLQSVLSKSEIGIQQYLKELENRKIPLPKFLNITDLFEDRITPYYDALELINFYYSISEENT